MTRPSPSPSRPLELWGGVECTVNRVGDKWFDQIVRSGHHTRLDDLDRFAALGLRVLRYPALWERLAPRGLDDIDWQWTDERFERLRVLGIRPIVGLLHHGSGPAYTSLIDSHFPERFASFAGAVARRYPWITDYTPINEPLTTARFSGLYGYWYPHGVSDRVFLRALVSQMRGIVLAMRAIREVVPHAALVQTEDCGRTSGRTALADQVEHEGHRRWLTWDLLTGRVRASHPLRPWLLENGITTEELAFFSHAPCPPDVLGLNYYLTSDRYLDDRLERYPPSLHGGNGDVRYADVEAVRVSEDGIDGHEAHLMEAWHRYRLPVAVTEVHLACSREEQVRWLAESWGAAQRARTRGADVRAVTAWALLGSFDWDSLVTRDAGHYEPGVFDVRAPLPRPTALAAVIQALSTNQEFDHVALQTPGWWHRPERAIYRDGASVLRTLPGKPPIVVIGASDTLAHLVRAAGALRGLDVRIVTLHDCELADPTAVDGMLRLLQPWAVINAAANQELAETHGPGVLEPSSPLPHVNLAAGCRRRGVSLATISSSHVFDGVGGGPFSEDDLPAPTGAVGRALVVVESRIRSVLPDSLIVRPGTLIVPSAESPILNCLAVQLAAAVGSDHHVSFAYLPHLVEALLDLILDGETGVWHLSNGRPAKWRDAANQLRSAVGDLTAPTERASHDAIAFSPVIDSVRGWPMPSLGRALREYAAYRSSAGVRRHANATP